MMVAYIMIHLLVPHVLHRYGRILFGLATSAVLYMAFVLYTAFRIYAFEVVFPEFYNIPPEVSFEWRIKDFYYFSKNIIWFLLPAVILMAMQYYRRQQENLTLREQKKSAELNALRNQLNPHFLFNTLNNLYALAIKKSDQTPEVIAKLSEILDYILYRCKKSFVPIEGEVNLLQNYISLEKVRYGQRVAITFNTNIERNLEIAPLLLLTFLENAFKHGVAQEIELATIDINLKTSANQIDFEICNSVSAHKGSTAQNASGIGLVNVKKQLQLLYGSHYQLTVKDLGSEFKVRLIISLWSTDVSL